MTTMAWSWWEMLAVVAACWLVGSFAVAVALGRIIRRSDEESEVGLPMRESLMSSEWLRAAGADAEADADNDSHSASSTRLKPVLAASLKDRSRSSAL